MAWASSSDPANSTPCTLYRHQVRAESARRHAQPGRATRPSFVLADATIWESAVATVEKLGLQLHRSPCRMLEPVPLEEGKRKRKKKRFQNPGIAIGRTLTGGLHIIGSRFPVRVHRKRDPAMSTKGKPLELDDLLMHHGVSFPPALVVLSALQKLQGKIAILKEPLRKTRRANTSSDYSGDG